MLLLDVSMPGMAVVDLIRALRSAGKSPRILVLSVHPERDYARRVLQAGADGYLTKNHSPTALAEAIRQVHSGRKYVTPPGGTGGGGGNAPGGRRRPPPLAWKRPRPGGRGPQELLVVRPATKGET